MKKPNAALADQPTCLFVWIDQFVVRPVAIGKMVGGYVSE